MSRKVRIRRKPEDEYTKLQNYLDKKVTEAMDPVLAAIYDMQGTVDAMKGVMLWLHSDLGALMNSPSDWHRLPLKVQESLTGLYQRLNAVTWAGDNTQAQLESMVVNFHKKMHTPAWLDDAMKEADDRDLSDLMDDD